MTCRQCGRELMPTGRPGRPAVLCPDCREQRAKAGNPKSHKRISPQVSGDSERITERGARVSSHLYMPNPDNPRYCRMCGRRDFVHVNNGRVA